MNPKKPLKPIVSILKDALSCRRDLCAPIHAKISDLSNMAQRSLQLRDAYALLRNTRTALTTYGPTKSLLRVINHQGQLEHAIKVMIPSVINDANRAEVVKDLVTGIDVAVENLMDRLMTYSGQHRDLSKQLIDNYAELAVRDKSVLCDLRQHVVAVGYEDKNLVDETKLCGCSHESFTKRVYALNVLQKSLLKPWADWNMSEVRRALRNLNYNLVEEQREDLDPEEQPEEPLDPEFSVQTSGNVEEGSDNPVPDSETDPAQVKPSVEQPAIETLHNLGWTRNTILDSINSLVAATDKMKSLAECHTQITAAVEALSGTTVEVGDRRNHEKLILSTRNYCALNGRLLSIYGQEMTRLVNDTINLVVRLHGNLERHKS